jgi:hypothetical protein
MSFEIVKSSSNDERQRFISIFDSNYLLIYSSLNPQCIEILQQLKDTYCTLDPDSFRRLKREVYKSNSELPKICLFITWVLNSCFVTELYFKDKIKPTDLIHYRRFESYNFISLSYLIQISLGKSDIYYAFLEELLAEIDSFEFGSVKIALYEIVVGILFSNSSYNDYKNISYEFYNYRKRFEQFVNIRTFVENLALKYRSQIFLNDEYLQLLNQYYYDTLNYFDDNEIDSSTMYYFLILKIDYQYYFQFDDLLESLSQLDFFLKTNQNTIGKARYFSGINNLVLHYFIIGKNDTATKIIFRYLDNKDLFPRQRINLFIILLNYFLIIKDFSNYVKYNELILSYEDSRALLLSNMQYNLIISVYCHHTNDFKNAHLYIQKASKLLSDKSGFGLGIRMLEIMNFIKWEKFEQLDSALINLKNHITLLKKGGKIKPRYIFIYKILLKLHTSGFDYKDTFRLHKDKLRLMNGEDRFYAFDFRGPELIRFDTWFFDQAGFIPDWPLNDFRLQ